MKIKIIITLVAFLCLGTVYFLGWSRDNQEVAAGNQEFVLELESTKESASEVQLQTETKSIIYVYVCGHVNFPGVYPLEADARVYEAVEMAGGAGEQGCTQYMEMAGFLYDGQRIYVPSWEEAESEAAGGDQPGTVSGNADFGLVNINTAGKNELMELPGIGEAKAEAIIRYRNEVGKFTTIEEIMNISGIKEAAFSKIKEHICAY